MTRRLHLVRPGAQPIAVGERDWVLYLDGRRLDARGAPPLPPGPIDDHQLVTLVFAADVVVTW